LRNLADMDAIKRVVDQERPGRAIVIGGGYIGLEMTEALRLRGVPVTLIELAKQVMGPADPEMTEPLLQQLRLHEVDVRLERSITRFEPVADGLRAMLSDDSEVVAQLIVMAIGVKPEVALAKAAGLTLGERGGIQVDAQMRTSDPAIYAVGDAVEVTDLITGSAALIPLAGPANRQGRIAADHICGRAGAYRHTQGTAICRVFETAIGMTGASEKLLQRLGRKYEKVYVHPFSHASYFPGAQLLSLKVLFDPVDGKLLGAQAVGADGVDKRIDVLATALRAGLTVYDLEHLELCYAPPYGSAKDPVNMAGFVAANALRGDTPLCHVAEVLALRPDQLLLDIRTTAEVQAGAFPGATHIPLDELRDRLAELPRDKEIIATCRVGQRGHVATRLLRQHGFAARNLSGGYLTYKMVTGGSAPVPTAPKSEAPAAPSCPPCGAPAPAPAPVAGPVREIDARGLQCPGPIMQLRNELATAAQGATVAITASDPGFVADVGAWCQSTGHRLVEVKPIAGGGCRAVIVKQTENLAACPLPSATAQRKGKTLVVFSGDFDKVMAAFVIANGALAMGSEVTMFFTFWGLNALRRAESVAVPKNFIEKMFGWMMPRGANKLGLSKMHMGGMGLAMIKGIMRKKHVASLEELIASAQRGGVRMVACTMSMDLMGIKREELIPGIEEGGVALYLNRAEQAGVNLFV